MRVALALLASSLLLSASPVHADRWWERAPMLGVVDAGRNPPAAHEAGATWDRVLFLWQEIQPSGPGDWYLDRYVDRGGLRASIDGTLPVVAIIQGTPGWAAGNARDGASGVPTGLDYPPDDPRNTFGQFMTRLARAYKGRITHWMLWNEPDFRPGESGSWWTWSGNTADFFSLQRAGYKAIKSVDPSATVLFPATTYFADAVNGRDLFLARVLQSAENDRDARTFGYYFDAVAVNLYCSLDAIYRVHGVYTEVLSRFGLARPIWLTETNCPVYNDERTPASPNGRITTDEQSAYVIQSVALARAAGYQRIGWYSLMDHDPQSGIVDRWGLLRADTTPRPALQTLGVAARYLADPDVVARLVPLGTPTADGWPVTRVILDDPGRRTRVHVLWRTAAGPSTVQVEATGSAARLVNLQGRSSDVVRRDQGWEVALPPARVPQPGDPPGFQSAGDPVLLVESGMPPGLAVSVPSVFSALGALAPAVVDARPAPPTAAGPPSAAALPAITQVGPRLVLSVANPQPNAVIPSSGYVVQGRAFDRGAVGGSGVDRVTVFLEDRNAGGQLLGEAKLGQPQPDAFTVTVDLSRASGKRTLYFYARSAHDGSESIVSLPVTVGSP